jgi:hypothetical protein
MEILRFLTAATKPNVRICLCPFTDHKFVDIRIYKIYYLLFAGLYRSAALQLLMKALLKQKATKYRYTAAGSKIGKTGVV